LKEYHRAKDAAARVPALLASATMEVEYADQMLNDLDMAESRAEIDAVILAAREAGLLTIARPRTKPAAVSEPRVYQSREGFTILVGKNARQNEEITFRRAKPDDLWLHARNAAGAHVVILQAGHEIPESTIDEAAALAAQSSQARDDSRVDVIVTPRKNVHRVRGGRTGMVTVRGERVVTVAPTGRAS
jgi:predicted ribosome quality control (RQC) complex YloA/Tae2 family protein